MRKIDDKIIAPSSTNDELWREMLYYKEKPSPKTLNPAAGPASGVDPFAFAALCDIYGPLCGDEDRYVAAHLGQSLDGRIATVTGASHYVTGPVDILHNHRLRALFDAVIVGAGTVALDNPQLTVRLCAGDNPVRVVLDPKRRLSDAYHVFQDGQAETLLICDIERAGENELHGKATVIGAPLYSGNDGIGGSDCSGLCPTGVLNLLAARGLKRVFIEGGGVTVSRFLHAGRLDRLHITVAPIIIGSGRPAITLPPIESLSDGRRPQMRRFDFGDDLLFDCDLSHG
jgi:diaminohydroxyphosphoribosylaminopyrimidine deaminase / 5-amino-6-(5-phosphoribosylamino)uracil reductase